MSMRIETFRYLSKAFQNIFPGKGVTNVKQPKIAPYSTVVPKCCIDVIDLFTDVLLFNRERSQSQNKKEAIKPISNEFSKKGCNETLFQNIDIADGICAQNALDKILQKNIVDQNWSNCAFIVEFHANKQIPMDRSNMELLVELYSNSGFLEGLLQLRVLMHTTYPERYLKEGELLTQLARCFWVASNSKECFIHMNEFFFKYPDLKDSAKMVLKTIIFEAVTNRSEAELRCTVSFIEQYTSLNNDFYYIAVLWNHLFLSDWFTDHNLADELLQRHEELRTIISLMSSSLGRYLIRCNRINDVYRLLQSFLKYKNMDSYAIVSQILFDHYCRKGDQYACSEIIKTSVRLKSPLREEQYNYFISWSATGDPFKSISATEIKKIYSDF